jgi:hypothetical protein
VFGSDVNVAFWPVTSLAVMQQFGRDRVESGHRADIVDRSKMTRFRHRSGRHDCCSTNSSSAFQKTLNLFEKLRQARVTFQKNVIFARQ